MRKQAISRRVLNIALAVVLACGMMVPAGAVAWADGSESAPQAGSNTFDSAVGDKAANPVDNADGAGAIGSAVRDAVSAYAAAAPTSAPVATPLADPGWTEVGDFQIQGGANNTDYALSGSILTIKSSTPLAIKMKTAGATTSQTIDIAAGVKADLTLAGVNISSTARSPINMITNSMDTATGVKATNANQIRNKTTLYLTIADGTTNNLLFTRTDETLSTGWPGIRCGWGSVLVIDDSVTNIKSGGSKFNLNDIVTPVNGMIGSDVTLLNGTTLKAGDALGKMDSANRGVLVAQGGLHSAGIGSGPSENSGTLIINGGDITAKITVNTYDFNGSAIGGGGNGSGTVITFNGGNVQAYGGGCGTAIGAGFGYHTASHNGSVAKDDAISVPTTLNSYALSQGYSFWSVSAAPYTYSGYDGVNDLAGTNVQTGTTLSSHTVAGDITINGGYIYAKAGIHGNAIGQSCGHGPNTNRGHIIRITGGTVKAETNTGSTNPYMFGIGARLGYTIVTGGSVNVQKGTSAAYNGKVLFQGLGGTAYNTLGVETWDDVVRIAGGEPVDNAGYTGKKLPDGDKVQMLEINLSADIMAKENTTTVRNKVAVTSWQLEIDGMVYDYGAPTYLEDGKAYVWVPTSATGKNVAVTMSYLGADGKEQKIEPLYVEEVGSSTGSVLKRYIDIDVEKLTGDAKNYFSSLKKEYDGEPLTSFDIAAKPIDTTDFEDQGKMLDNPSSVTNTYQLYDAKGGDPLAAAVAGNTMPADTGIYQVQFVSKQYATGPFGNSYWGHRITGWAEITPVPAVLDLKGVQWGYLNPADNSWSEINEGNASAGMAGNRLKLDFTIRSANTTALTCAAPTGSFQVKVDGVAVGDPIPLTKEAFDNSPGSTINLSGTVQAPGKNGGTETRNATIATYYLNPANRDALLALLAAADSREHRVTVEYIADKNYIQGVDLNPENEQEEETFIVPVPPKGDVEPEDPEKVTIEETPEGERPDPVNPTDPTKPDVPKDMEVVYKTVTVPYGKFHKDGLELEDFFNLDLESTSSVPPTFDVSNLGVADFVSKDGQVVLTPKGENKNAIGIQVNSCGESVLRITQQPNAFYTGIQYVITVNVTPDPTIKPKVQIRLTSRNLTALQEKAEEIEQTPLPEGDLSAVVSVVAAVYAADTGRVSTPPRPGDVMEYTVTGLNMTPGSAWQAAKLTDAIGDNLEFIPESVEVASNYTTHNTAYNLGTPEFYSGFNWDGLAWQPVAATGYTFSSQTLAKEVGSVYGGQSTSVRFQATVKEGLGERPEDGELPRIESTPGGSGGYGKDESELVPGEEASPAEPLTPGTDIVVVGAGGTADDDPMKPNDESGTISEPVLPRDPDSSEIRTTITVDITDMETPHDPDRILIGDTLKITATSENIGPDSELVNAVIKVTLPKGVEPKSGTLMLMDAQGNPHPVPDSAYDPATGIIAVNAGDIYGGEKATLTFDAVVESTKDTRGPEEQGGERPDDFPIQGGTLGGTPTGEFIDTHPDGPDGTALEPDKPEVGSPFNPGKPWDEYEKEVVTGEPGTAEGMPPVLPMSPVVTGPDADILVEKVAENTTRDDGTTHVGDVVRYTVTLSNSKAKSVWYDAVIRDNLPKGIEPMSGTIKLTGPDGVERPVPDSCYSTATRIMGVQAGDLPGGRTAVLVFDALVTEAATGEDIGNTATAYGTRPSDTDPSNIASGEARPTPGAPFQPEEGWGNWERGKDTVSNKTPAYAPGTSAIAGVLPADNTGAGDGPGNGSGDGSGNGTGGLLAQTGTKGSTILSKTGDENPLGLYGAVALASGAVLLLMVAARRSRRRER